MKHQTNSQIKQVVERKRIKRSGEKNKEKISQSNEIVFCGYGEPLIKINEVVEISKYLKENFSSLKIRINTNGHANAIHKRNVAGELAPYIDIISVSLNGQNSEHKRTT